MRADKADASGRLLGLDRFSDFGVVAEGRRGGMDDYQVEVLRCLEALLNADAVRWAVHELAIGDQRRGLREPGRIPKRSHFALGLITRSGAAIEAIVGRRT